MKMKYRIKHSIMSLAACLAAAWSAVSCTETDPLPAPQEPVSATLTARMDAAWEDAVRGSADGGLTNLLGKGYYVRYQLEVYPEAGDNPECEYRAEPEYRELKADGDYATVSYDLRLLARRYRFVIWADLVKMDADAQTVSSSWYNVADLQAIYADPAPANAPADVADAFTAVQTVDLTTAGQAVSMTLKRPLAKVRVIDAGAAAASAEQASAGAFSTALTFSQPLPSGYNALLQQAVSPDGTGYVLPARNSYSEGDAGVCLFEGFVFAPAEPADVTVAVKKNPDETAGSWSIGVQRVPLRPNGLTTLKGTVVK